MKFRGMVGLLTLVVFLALAGGGLAQEQGVSLGRPPVAPINL